MAELISYKRQYNESALEGEDLRFYGFDMQRISYIMRFLEEVCKELEVGTTNLWKVKTGAVNAIYLLELKPLHK